MIVDQASAEVTGGLLVIPYRVVLFDVLQDSYLAFFPNKSFLERPQQWAGGGLKWKTVCVFNFHLKMKICLTLENKKAIHLNDKVFIDSLIGGYCSVRV